MVDALASGASVRMDVEVRVLSWAPFPTQSRSSTRRHRAAFFRFSRPNPEHLAPKTHSSRFVLGPKRDACCVLQSLGETRDR